MVKRVETRQESRGRPSNILSEREIIKFARKIKFLLQIGSKLLTKKKHKVNSMLRNYNSEFKLYLQLQYNISCKNNNNRRWIIVIEDE